MVRTYESTNDKWRAFGYQKAIQVLRKHPKPITTFEVRYLNLSNKINCLIAGTLLIQSAGVYFEK